MAEFQDREHYIPLRRSELVALLEGQLPDESERESFSQLCRLVTAMYHFQYHDKLEEMKDEYATFDPDSQTQAVQYFTDDERQNDLTQMIEKFTWLMDKANFKHMTKEELQAATDEASDWGLNLDIDFSAFDHLEVFVRGDTVGKRFKRHRWKFWQQIEMEVAVHQRVAVVFKQKKNKRFGPNPNTQSVYLKLFKDIPKQDVEMLIPGGRLKMPLFAKGKLGVSLLASVGFVGFKLFGMLSAAVLTLNPIALWGPVSLIGGYGYKQFHGYQNAKQTYRLQLTQSLYYQTLDSNSGVLFHLLDEAEEQECREAILGYYYLWRQAPEIGWTAGELDDRVEQELERLAKIEVDFEIEDAMDKLESLGIVEKSGDLIRAISIEKALESLDYQWDNYFQYNKAGSETEA